MDKEPERFDAEEALAACVENLEELKSLDQPQLSLVLDRAKSKIHKTFEAVLKAKYQSLVWTITEMLYGPKALNRAYEDCCFRSVSVQYYPKDVLILLLEKAKSNVSKTGTHEQSVLRELVPMLEGLIEDQS